MQKYEIEITNMLKLCGTNVTNVLNPYLIIVIASKYIYKFWDPTDTVQYFIMEKIFHVI